MPDVKYTDSATFRCLENLKEGSLDISLIIIYPNEPITQVLDRKSVGRERV